MSRNNRAATFNAINVGRPSGRREVDALVKAHLTVQVFYPVRDIASWVYGDKAPDDVRRLVSASLKRGVRDGWAVVDGKGAWSRYAAKTKA